MSDDNSTDQHTNAVGRTCADSTTAQPVTTTKTKFFNTLRQEQTQLRAPELWKKYILTSDIPMTSSLDSSYVDAIHCASGVQYTVKTVSAFSATLGVINTRDHCTDVNWLRQQADESIIFSAGYYNLTTSSLSGRFVAVGVRELYPPVYHAVEEKNIALLKEVLFPKDGKKPRYISILGDNEPTADKGESLLNDSALLFDPNERPVRYKLETTNLTKEALINLGGPNFQGYYKTYTSSMTGPDGQDAMSGMKRQRSFVAADESSVDLASIPDFSTLGCVWKRDTQACLPTPLERAYELDDNTAVDTLLQVERVRSVDTLRLYSKLRGGFIPEGLSQMRSLTSLTLCFPWSGHPVSDIVFTVTSLKRLILTGCIYTKVPDTISQLTRLEELNVAGLPLTSLPVLAMGTLRNLTSVDCSGIKLASPPPEIVAQGPRAVARYIVALGDGAEENHDVLLMLIGDGEAGKTSMLRALKNLDGNCASQIDTDDRTVGIDISSFQPILSKPLRFFAWDFGGQGIYAIMQQLFVSRRALYPLLWRVRQSLDVRHMDAAIKCDVCRKRLVAADGEKQEPVYRVKGQGLCHSRCVSYEPLISSWTERLQFRVPGVALVLVATHIDCATPEEVDEQCAAVKEVVRRIQERQAVTMKDVPPLRVYNAGESLRINNMTGEGVAELRRTLVKIAEGLDFYGEVIPASYVRLRQRLRDMQRRDSDTWRTWLLHDEYALIAKECGLHDVTTLQLATRFFHEVGELKYFGLPEDTGIAAGEEYDSDSEWRRPQGTRDDEATARRMDGASTRLLMTTVFPNPFWIVDVLRGLIRHDQGSMLGLIKGDATTDAKDKRTLRRRVYRLMQRGLLHDSLLRYVWHSVAGGSDDSDSNADEFARLIALMKAFDILMDKPGCRDGAEWIVPALAAGKYSRTIESDAFIDDSLPFVCRLVYDALPPYFDMILVAHIMNAGVFETVDFIEGAAAFHKLAEKALLFAGLGKVRDPSSVFRREQLSEGRLCGVLRENQSHVVIAATSREFMLKLMDEVTHIETFFPGLRRLCALFPCYSCRLKRSTERREVHPDNPPVTSQEVADPVVQPAAQVTDEERELDEAEAQDLVAQAYLLPAAHADSFNCGAYYAQHRTVLQPALRETYKDLGLLIEFSEKGEYAIRFKPNCLVQSTYGMYAPRTFKEALMVMMRVVAVLDPTSEEAKALLVDDDHQRAVEQCQTAVADRQFATAFQQAGAELPTLRSINKYCARYVDSLAVAWQLCPELEVLCMSLNAALQDEKSDAGNPSAVAALAAASLKREYAAPEYMHLLRSTVELFGPHLRPQSAATSNVHPACALRSLQEERRCDLDLLMSKLPNLRSCVEDVLPKTYGDGTTACSEEQLLVLQEALHVLDAALMQGTSEDSSTTVAREAALRAEAQLHAGDSETGIAVERFRRALCQVADGLQSKLAALLQQVSSIDAQLVGAEKRRVVAQLTNGMNVLLRNALPGFDASQYSTMEQAFASCLHQDSAQVTLIAELMYGGAEKTSIFSYHSASPEADPEEELAATLELFLLLARAVTAALESDRDLAAAFQESYGRDTSVTYGELCDLYRRRQWLIALLVEGMQVDGVDRVFMNRTVDDNQAGLFCAFDVEKVPTLMSAESSNQRRGARPGFAPPFAVYTLLKDLSTALQDQDAQSGRLLAMMDRLATWELTYPLPLHTSDQLIDLYSEYVKDPKLHMAGLKLGFCYRDTALALMTAVETLETVRYPFYVQEMVRTFKYLKDGGDHSLLGELVNTRIADIKEYSGLAKGFSLTSETIEAMEAAFARYSGLLSARAAVLDTVWNAVGLEEINAAFVASQQRRTTTLTELATSIVSEAIERMQTYLQVYALKCQAIEASAQQLEAIVQRAEARAALWRGSFEEKVRALADTSLSAELSTLVAASKAGIATYLDLEECVRNVRDARIADIAATTTARAYAYRRLVTLRNKYGPPWHFGGGERAEVEPVRTGSTLKADCLQVEKWEDDLRTFTSTKMTDTIDAYCPAESFEVEDGSVTAQPKEYFPVVVLHTQECYQAFVAKIVQNLNAVGLRSIATSDAIPLAGAKVVICLIDEHCSRYEDYEAMLREAERLGLGIAPVILSGYTISNYQKWWPESLSVLERHSLFIDARSVATNKSRRDPELDRICAFSLVPTIRALLSEYDGRSASSVQEQGTSSTGVQAAGPQFVTCELCAAEGPGAATDGRCSGPVVVGRFDRWECQRLVSEWTTNELKRREEFRDSPVVATCPATVCCTGPGAHSQLVRDVLALKEKKTSYPCPSCVSKGVLPPHCFDREACLAELEYNHGGSILCKRCHGSTALHSLLVCEVFLSYCWGAAVCPGCSGQHGLWQTHRVHRGRCATCDTICASGDCLYDTQRLVSQLKHAVEPEAGVMCWQDTDRLVGGKDLEREMEVGVQQADVVVIFLDDGYVNSFNCRREYLHCTKHGKYVIPVLLRGYTMATPERWWPESMSSLGQFEPVVLREAEQWEQALFEICERIQSRFHRAQRFPTADDAIAYLRDYSSWGVARRAFLRESLTLQRRDEVDAHLREMFQRIDRDGNELIDEAELAAFLDEHKLSLSGEQLSTLVMEADLDHNGLLNMEELKLAVYAMLESREGTNVVVDDN